jgi:hypothetical protein
MTTAAATGTPRKRRSRSTPKAEPNSSSPASTTSSSRASAEPPRVPMKVYVARKRMKVNGAWLTPGEVVPWASDLPRVESWVRAGFLNEEMR